jgi:hypothetical protein
MIKETGSVGGKKVLEDMKQRVMVALQSKLEAKN